MQLSAEQQRLVEDNLALVRKVIRDKVHGAGSIGVFTYEDLYQIGCIGLCKAAYTDKYQYAYNRENTHTEDEMRFSTYAYRLIWNEICKKLEYATKLRAESAIDADEIFSLVRPDPAGVENDVAKTEFHIALAHIMHDAERSAADSTAKGIKALKYLAEGYTSTEIAGMMGGASCHHVTAWISKARKFLKANPELVELMCGT